MNALLEVKNLHKSYGDIKAVDGINLSLNKGEIIGLLGPNGAGKSTAISMICTLIDCDEGSIFFDGFDISKNPRAIQKSLGIVPQEIALYPQLSGMDNLKFWANIYGIKKDEIDKRIEIVSEIIAIDERLKDKVSTYSGGMKRRLNIGVALLNNPTLLIMDEPTVGVDPQSRNHILNAVKKLNEEGTSVIYTSHYIEEVEFLCSYIYIMDNGKIIASGTSRELIAKISKKYTNANLEDVFLELTGKALRD